MGIKEIISRVKRLKNLKVKAGVLGATYVDTGQSVADVAMWNEYGTSTSPARPFLRTTLVNNSDEWADGFRKMSLAFIQGKGDLETIADKMGVAMQTGILETIDSNMPPPNSVATVRQKVERGMTPRTLIDSGVMRDSISYDYDIGSGFSLESKS